MCRASTGHPSTAGQHEVEMEHTAVHQNARLYIAHQKLLFRRLFEGLLIGGMTQIYMVKCESQLASGIAAIELAR